MKRYSWKASSDDGSYEVEPQKWFDTKKDAYNDMRKYALEKMKWNTEWCDFSDMAEEDWIGYNVKFHPNYIVHESYSGIYTYEIVSQSEKVSLHDREWEVIDLFTPDEDVDWEVCEIHGVGKMWMNNYDGYIVLIEPSGRILKSIF
jgi:hypothetical protein